MEPEAAGQRQEGLARVLARPRAPKGDIYRHYTWGPGLEIFHLDTRSHRDSNAAPRAGKTMLGPAQRAWLFEALAASKARFKLVITSIPLDYGLTGKDQWTGFVEERDAMLAHIRDKKIHGVVFLTADQHWAASHHLPSGAKQWQTGPIGYIAFKTPKRPPFQTAYQRSAKNFGILDYQPGSPATLTFRSHLDREGIVFEETVREGAGRIEIKAPGPAWRWTLKGAHRFTGGGTQTLPMAPPGDYVLSWIPAKGAAPVDGGTKTLTDGGSIVFERAP